MHHEVKEPYLVHLILDPSFGERLAALPPDEPVWIADSATNKAVAERLWRVMPRDHLTGITTFCTARDFLPEEEFLDILGTIDLHHGEHSASLAFAILEVIGCPASARVVAALSEIGFRVSEERANGFTAVRRGA